MKILKLLPIIGISILVYIIYKVGLVNIYKTLITANLYYVLISLLFLGLAVLGLILKWYTILKIQNINIDFLYAVKLYLIGIFYGAITPARSGSIIRASYLKDKGKPFGECVSSIILERLMDLFVLFIFSIIGCIVFSKYIANWLPIFLIFFVIFGILSIFLLKKRMNQLIFKFIYNFLIPKKLKDKSKEIYHAFYSNIPSFKKLIYPLLLTVITWGLLGVYVYFIGKSYGANISLINMILMLSIVTVISLIPITIGGLGTREASWIFLFSFFGVEAVKAVSISFLFLFMGNILIPLVGFFVSLKEPAPDGLI